MRYILLLFLSFCALGPAQAQNTIIGLDRQTVYIEAKQQALLGNLDAAIDQFLDLDERAPGNDAVAFELARLYKAKDQSNDAIDWMKKAYAANPDENYAAYYAELLEQNGRYAAGADLMADLVKRHPDNPGYYLDQAEFLTLDGDVKAAVKVYESLESRIGVNETVSRLKHTLYLNDGDPKKAEKELLALVEAKPDVLRYRHLLAGFYQARNDNAAAARVYRDILAREPNDVRAQLALQTTAPPRKASSNDELLAALRNTSIDIDLKIGRLLPVVQAAARSEVPSEVQVAERAALELVRVHPDEAKATALLGDLYAQTNRPRKAAEAYRTTLELDDSRWAVWQQLLVSLYLTNDDKALRDYAERALDVYPNRPPVYIYYALGELLRGNYGEATALLDQTSIMVAENSPTAAMLGTLQSVVENLAKGELTGANPEFSHLPGGKSGPLGVLLTAAADPAGLQAYATDQGGTPLLLEILGDAHAAAGNKTAAAAAYQQARSAGSKSPQLRSKLAKVQ